MDTVESHYEGHFALKRPSQYNGLPSDLRKTKAVPHNGRVEDESPRAHYSTPADESLQTSSPKKKESSIISTLEFLDGG